MPRPIAARRAITPEEAAMLYMVGAFDFDQTTFPGAEAERHYLDYHVPLASRLPGLRRYAIGRLVATPAIPADRYRAAILGFESLDAWRAAYRSDVGRELRADERRLLLSPRALLIDGEDVV